MKVKELDWVQLPSGELVSEVLGLSYHITPQNDKFRLYYFEPFIDNDCLGYTDSKEEAINEANKHFSEIIKDFIL